MRLSERLTVNSKMVDTRPVDQRTRVPWRDFQGVLGSALLLLALVFSSQAVRFLQPLRLLIGLLWVLYMPGYSLAAALFPKAGDLDGIERAGLSVGLSIASVPGLALLLDLTPWGLHPVPILLSEYALTAFCAGIALWRRARLPAGVAYAPALSWQARSWWRALGPADRRTYQLIAAVVLFASIAVAWVLLAPAPGQRLTEFYMLGRDGRAENYPYTVTAGEPLSVTLGIVNKEQRALRYRVQIRLTDPWEQGQDLTVAESGPIELGAGEVREWPVSWAMPEAGDGQTVELLLYQGNDGEPYRRLRMTIDVETN